MDETNSNSTKPEATPEKKSEGSTGSKSAHVNGMAYVAYIIFFIPLLTDSKDDPFVKYHVKQGLTLWLAWIAVWIFTMIPLIGWILGPLLWIVLIVLFILGLVNVSKGEKKPLPIIGSIGEKWSF